MLSELPGQWQQWQGQVVGNFTLLQYLGGSPDRAVFLTNRNGNKAAIRLVRADSDKARLLVSRWKQCAELSHPHLLRVFETGEARIKSTPVAYAVMEFADEDLSQLLPLRAMTTDEAKEMIRDVSSALSYLHGKNLVHGSVRPANIRAIGDQIKLANESVLPAGEHDYPKSQASVYDAPERAAAGATPAGDVWSLGMTLVESLTRRTPAQSEPVLREVLSDPFDKIAWNCLQHDPERRWRIDDILAALKPTTPEPTKKSQAPVRPAAPYHDQSEADQKPGWGKWVAIAAVVLLIAVLVVPRMLRRGNQTASRSETAPSTVAPVAATAPSTTSADAPGAVLNQVLPNPSASARHTIQGTIRVRVRVSVDASGSVTATSFESRGPSAYFARISSEAAREWKFTPPRVNGQSSASQWVIRFEFRRTETKAIPEMVG